MATFSSGTNLHSTQLNLSCMGLCHSIQHTSNMQSTNYSFKHLHTNKKKMFLFFPSGIRSCSAGARVHFLWACCSVTIYRRCLWPFVGATFVSSSTNEDSIWEQKKWSIRCLHQYDEHLITLLNLSCLLFISRDRGCTLRFFFVFISHLTSWAEREKNGGRNFSPFKCDDDGFIIVNVIQYVGLSHHHLSTTATIVCVCVSPLFLTMSVMASPCRLCTMCSLQICALWQFAQFHHR